MVETHKFLCNRELCEELEAAKVIARGNSSTRVVKVSRVHICLVRIFWPYSYQLLSLSSVYVCVCVYVCMYVCACVRVCMCVCAYVCVYTRLYVLREDMHNNF